MLICWMNWVPWGDVIVVSVFKLRKLWDSRSELRSSLCERRLERIFLRPALLPVKTAQFTQFFRQVWPNTVKSLSLNENVEGALRNLWINKPSMRNCLLVSGQSGSQQTNKKKTTTFSRFLRGLKTGHRKEKHCGSSPRHTQSNARVLQAGRVSTLFV